MTPNASKQGKFGSLGAIFLFIFSRFCMWGWGFKKNPRIKIGLPNSVGFGPFGARQRVISELNYDPAGLVKSPKSPETQKYEKIAKKI